MCCVARVVERTKMCADTRLGVADRVVRVRIAHSRKKKKKIEQSVYGI